MTIYFHFYDIMFVIALEGDFDIMVIILLVNI